MTTMLTGKTIRARQAKAAWPCRRGDGRAPRPRCRKFGGDTPTKNRARRPFRGRFEFAAGPKSAGSAHEKRGGEKSTGQALSCPQRTDRSVGKGWWQPGGDAERWRFASFSRLLVTPTAQNLIRVFFLRENLKSFSDGNWQGQRIHVIGAGAMGGDIAAWCAWHGFTVSLADMKAEPLAGADKARRRFVQEDRA